MNLADVKRRKLAARRLGMQVEETDYGWTTGARFPGQDVALKLTEVFREERDGYIGSKMISLSLLKEWADKHRPKS